MHGSPLGAESALQAKVKETRNNYVVMCFIVPYISQPVIDW